VFFFRFNDFRVWPTIVEAELQKHPAVLECMIYGKPNPPTMELVSAAIVLKKGYTKVKMLL
jgi:acyl-coenzyme A synthetase/AMP-(fatty) acid ligase